MRNLYWDLARLDCLGATLYLARRDFARARLYVARAAGLLECRARARDSSERWQPIIGTEEIKPE
jgi:hypothetical protein